MNIKLIQLVLIVSILVLLTSCMSARDIYEFNYGDDSQMQNDMLNIYGDPFN